MAGKPRSKRTAKAKPAKAKPAHAKPKAKSRAKPKSKSARSKPARSKPARSKPARSKPDRTRLPEHVEAPPPLETSILLGEVTAPSGRLAIFDVGLVGYLPRPALEPAIVKADVPADRPLPVTGVLVGKGRFARCWDHVAIALNPGEVASSRKLGEAGVDFARLICIDHAALDHWVHDDSLDGRADFVFWGRDAAQLAKVMNARRLADGHGWADLPVAEAEARADEAARRKASNKWLLATDLRPHSHHFHALAAARRSPHGAGSLELAGSRLVLFFTSWGDGVFPIYLDRDAAGRPVQVRIQLATPAASAASGAGQPVARHRTRPA
jgi:hypothetical protein